MITINDKKNCCGCSACANICPRHCILMTEDEEGFLYPKVDEADCLNCGLCEKVCPTAHYANKDPFDQKAFVVQHRDVKILEQSTSGGAFTAIAKWVLDLGGVVFGVGLHDSLEAEHLAVDKYEDLEKFRNSKYVQSNTKDSYSQVKKLLNDNRIVLYSGTPCQLEGLFQYLRNKEYDNLYTVDVVCRAVPSPLVLRKYLEMQKNVFSTDFQNVRFRDKYHGYKYSSMSLFSSDENVYHEGIDTDVYLRAFFSGMSIRHSCTECRFRNRYRRTDFTIWDCFNIDDFSSELDNDKGATRILCHSERAVSILESLSSELKIVEVDVEKAIKDCRELTEGPKFHPLRSEFFVDLNSLPTADVFKKYFPVTIRHRLEKQARLWSNRLGIYKIMKKFFKRLHGNGEIKR